MQLPFSLAPLVKNCPEFMQYLREYVQYHIVEDPLMRRYAAAAEYDGIGRLEFDSLDEIMAVFNEPAYLRTIRPDEHNILDSAAPVFIAKRRRLAI